MIKILGVPRKFNKFFKPCVKYFSKPQWKHFRILVLAWAIAMERRNCTGLSRTILNGTHRTKLGDFLIRSPWNPEQVLTTLAYQTLDSLGLGSGDEIFLIVDDTHTTKRGKQMQAAGKFKDPVRGGFLWGHNIVFATIFTKGVTIPLALRLYKKREYCRQNKESFLKITELAAQMVRDFVAPPGVEVTVLFDSYYLCRTVLDAVKEKGFSWVSMLKSNRNLLMGGRKTKAGRYAKNIIRRGFHRIHIQVWANKKTYRVASRQVELPKFGLIRMVASQRGKDKPLALATDKISLSARRTVETYENRWSIELFFKQVKQHLGLGEYQNRRAVGAVKHLHLAAIAYSFLTHLGLKPSVPGAKRKQTIASCSIRKLQDRLRGVVFNDLVHMLYKGVRDNRTALRLGRLLLTT